MEPFGNVLPNTKRLLIKQTSYCALAQSKSKSPTINKKKQIPFCFVWPKRGKSFYPPAEKKKFFKSSCPSSKSQKEETDRLLIYLFCLLFLPSCNVQSGQILTYLMSNSGELCVTPCVRKSL